MANPRACPICRGAEMVGREGKLDQSGNTYLPTVVLSCPVCGYTKFAPAVGARWKSELEAAQTVGTAGERKAA
jgi:predicted RNA-binding Zn-ribbon protein involved in translation (DUF1610 family)